MEDGQEETFSYYKTFLAVDYIRERIRRTEDEVKRAEGPDPIRLHPDMMSIGPKKFYEEELDRLRELEEAARRDDFTGVVAEIKSEIGSLTGDQRRLESTLPDVHGGAKTVTERSVEAIREKIRDLTDLRIILEEPQVATS